MLNESNLHPYQKAAIEHADKNTHAALFLDMGLGKTVSTLTLINRLIYQELEISSVLVVAPKRVAENVWHTEVLKWVHLTHLTFSIVSGTPKQRRKALAKHADIHLISRDNLPWLCGLYGGGMLPFDMLVIDELSSFKNSGSQRFKALKKVQPSFKRVLGLTGTPRPNSLMDLWSQVYLLDRGQRLGKFIGEFRTNYFTSYAMNGYNRYEAKKPSEQRVYAKISDICLSMKAKDYLSLPPFTVNDMVLPMGRVLEKKYEDFKKEKVLDFLETLQGGEITAMNAASLCGKLLQFSNGAIYDEDKNWHEIHDLKIQALLEMLEFSDGPILLAWTFRHDMYRITKALEKTKYRFAQPEKNEHIDMWNRRELDLLMMHPASGGHGLNLQAGGNNIVWFGQTWSAELFEQFNARLYRQGQTKPVIMTRLITKNTMDVRVVSALKNKQNGQNACMEAVKAVIAEYS